MDKGNGGVDVATVKTHLQHLFDKTGATAGRLLSLVAGLSLPIGGGNAAANRGQHARPVAH
ncbi:MAG: hypothetical protein U0S49_12510 [Rhodospirillales bacterium]|nr:hypothetical protein [Rhodospirillales bacterium]